MFQCLNRRSCYLSRPEMSNKAISEQFQCLNRRSCYLSILAQLWGSRMWNVSMPQSAIVLFKHGKLRNLTIDSEVSMPQSAIVLFKHRQRCLCRVLRPSFQCLNRRSCYLSQRYWFAWHGRPQFQCLNRRSCYLSQCCSGRRTRDGRGFNASIGDRAI